MDQKPLTTINEKDWFAGSYDNYSLSKASDKK